MRQFDGFKSEKQVLGFERLPAGAYVAKILEAKVENVQTKNGERETFLISFDIVEGEHKDFFRNDFKNQSGNNNQKWRGVYRMWLPTGDGSDNDKWTIRTFNGVIWAIEKSNSGYRWDWNEAALKGKMIGVNFRNREWAYNGKTGVMTECAKIESVEDVRSGNFAILKDKKLPEDVQQTNFSASSSSNNFTTVEDDDLPFD